MYIFYTTIYTRINTRVHWQEETVEGKIKKAYCFNVKQTLIHVAVCSRCGANVILSIGASHKIRSVSNWFSTAVEVLDHTFCI